MDRIGHHAQAAGRWARGTTGALPRYLPALASLRRLRPMAAKPSPISASVPGSGTTADSNESELFPVICTEPLPSAKAKLPPWKVGVSGASASGPIDVVRS